MPAQAVDDKPSDRPEEVVSFRVPADRKHLIKAAASRRDEFVSEWLRRAAERQLSEELQLGESDDGTERS